MRVSAFAFSLLLLPGLARAQDQGMAINMGRGIDSGMSVGWTFKENWTLRPTIAAAYSDQTGFEASLGATVLRSVAIGPRLYAYAGAGVYYGSANAGVGTTLGGPGQTAAGGPRGSPLSTSLAQSTGSLAYFTAPAGLRARIYGNFEAFAEAAYQHTLSGQFGLSQTGQFSGNGNERFGATLGITIRLQ